MLNRECSTLSRTCRNTETAQEDCSEFFAQIAKDDSDLTGRPSPSFASTTTIYDVEHPVSSMRGMASLLFLSFFSRKPWPSQTEIYPFDPDEFLSRITATS